MASATEAYLVTTGEALGTGVAKAVAGGSGTATGSAGDAAASGSVKNDAVNRMACDIGAALFRSIVGLTLIF